MLEILELGKRIEKNSYAELDQGRYGRPVGGEPSQGEGERFYTPLRGSFVPNPPWDGPPTLGNGSSDVRVLVAELDDRRRHGGRFSLGYGRGVLLYPS